MTSRAECLQPSSRGWTELCPRSQLCPSAFAVTRGDSGSSCSERVPSAARGHPGRAGQGTDPAQGHITLGLGSGLARASLREKRPGRCARVAPGQQPPLEAFFAGWCCRGRAGSQPKGVLGCVGTWGPSLQGPRCPSPTHSWCRRGCPAPMCSLLFLPSGHLPWKAASDATKMSPCPHSIPARRVQAPSLGTGHRGRHQEHKFATCSEKRGVCAVQST